MSLRIVFAGTPEFTLPCLSALARSKHQLLAIYTQPDRPSGRGRQLHASAVKQWALQNQLPIYQPVHFKEEQCLNELALLKPDVLVVIAYGLILPKTLLSIPRLGCINVHASLLPRWRGASPIQHAILHGDKQTGVTIMQMDAGMDTGDLLTTVPCSIEPHETAGQLHDKLAQLAVKPLLLTLEQLALEQSTPQKQDNAHATYAGKIQKKDANIQWHKTAQEIDNQIRAFNPWPIAYTQVDDVTLRIYEANVIDYSSSAIPGTILALNKNGLLVATGSPTQALLIKSIQFPGAKIVSVAEWLNANHSKRFVGLILKANE